MNDDTFDIFLSPHFDNHYFTSNTPKKFKNFIPKKIRLYNNLAAFIRLKQIYIKGIHEKNFIVCLDGLAPSFTDNGNQPILTYCSINKNNSYNQYTIFNFENSNNFIPFSLAREENWNITIKKLNGGEIEEDSTADCIIHLTLKTHFNFDMSIIHKSFLFKSSIDESNSFSCNHLTYPIKIKGSEKVGITDISLPTIINMRKPFNRFLVFLLDPIMNNNPSPTHFKTSHEYTITKKKEGGNVHTLYGFPISFLPGHYETLPTIDHWLNNTNTTIKDQYRFKMDYVWNHQKKQWTTRIQNISPFEMIIEMKEELTSILGLSKSISIEANSYIVGEKSMDMNATIPKICLLTSPIAKEAYSGNKVFNVLKTFKYTPPEEDVSSSGVQDQQTDIHFDNITFYEASPGEYSRLKFEIRDFTSGKIIHNHEDYKNKEAIISLIVK